MKKSDLITQFAVDIGAQNIKVIIQQDEVGRVARAYLAKTGQSEAFCLVQGGGFYELTERLAGDAVHVLQSFGVAEG